MPSVRLLFPFLLLMATGYELSLQYVGRVYIGHDHCSVFTFLFTQSLSNAIGPNIFPFMRRSADLEIIDDLPNVTDDYFNALNIRAILSGTIPLQYHTSKYTHQFTKAFGENALQFDTEYRSRIVAISEETEKNEYLAFIQICGPLLHDERVLWSAGYHYENDSRWISNAELPAEYGITMLREKPRWAEALMVDKSFCRFLFSLNSSQPPAAFCTRANHFPWDCNLAGNLNGCRLNRVKLNYTTFSRTVADGYFIWSSEPSLIRQFKMPGNHLGRQAEEIQCTRFHLLVPLNETVFVGDLHLSGRARTFEIICAAPQKEDMWNAVAEASVVIVLLLLIAMVAILGVMAHRRNQKGRARV